MTPFADFFFFGMLLYVLVPTVILGLMGKANRRWMLISSTLVLIVQFWGFTPITPKFNIETLWLVAGYAAFQTAVTAAYLRWKTEKVYWAAIILSILPLAVVKYLPVFAPDDLVGFLGISYITFRALDVIFSIHDKLIVTLPPAQYLGYLFFWPTVSSGPIDRYRRFARNWGRARSRAEFLNDLDSALARIAQGFLYKFIIAALLKVHWVDQVAVHPRASEIASYMYGYTFYLFFDFAGYSAFAIGFSRIFGVHTPENFDMPFLAKNIRDFWNRWHISLSFWFRDHLYMRFVLAAGKRKWFKGKHTASYAGLFLTFGIMGIWHGPEWYYIIYGIYHATLLSCYDAFARWNKQSKVWKDGPWWRVLNIVLTFHAIAFGLLIFSGRLFPHVPPKHDEAVLKLDCDHIVGYAWDRDKGDVPLHVYIYIDDALVGALTAGEYMEDLRDLGMGKGFHGFTFKMPPYIHDGRSHSVEARVHETERVLRGTPESLACPKPEEPKP